MPLARQSVLPQARESLPAYLDARSVRALRGYTSFTCLLDVVFDACRAADSNETHDRASGFGYDSNLCTRNDGRNRNLRIRSNQEGSS